MKLCSSKSKNWYEEATNQIAELMDSPEFEKFQDYFVEPKTFEYQNFEVKFSKDCGRFFAAK